MSQMTLPITVSSPCIEHDGWRDANGYGRRRYKGKTWAAHRAAYDQAFGPIPPGMSVCHSCDNPSCVNPDHLWLGTLSDNQRDSVAKGRHRTWSSDVTHCPRGHEYDEANTYLTPRTNRRQCRACHRERTRDARSRHGAAA